MPQNKRTPPNLPTLSKTGIKKNIAIMASFDKSLYAKACIVAKRKGITVQAILRNILSDEVSKEMIN